MTRVTCRTVAPAALLLWVALATTAQAHGFNPGLSPYLQIKVGAKLVLANTEILLPLVASGLLLSFWSWVDIRRGLAAFYAGILLGFPLVFVLQIDMIWVNLALVFLTGFMIAMNKFAPKPLLFAGLAGMGASALSLGFLGHGLAGMPPFIMGNYLFTSTLVLSAALSVGLVAKDFAGLVWVPIVIRILGSWVSAVAILIFAFFIGMPDG